MPQVEVRTFATLRRYVPAADPGNPLHLQLAPGATVGDLIAQLHLPAHEVKQTFVNHRSVPESYLLQDGDRVSIFPLVAGG